MGSSIPTLSALTRWKLPKRGDEPLSLSLSLLVFSLLFDVLYVYEAQRS